MIINLGKKLKKLKTGYIENSSCPNCNSKNNLIYSVYSGYVNVVIIPTLPVKKVITLECSNCKKTYRFKDLTKDIQEKFNQQYKKDPIKVPFWHYTGSFILVIILSFAIYTGIQVKKVEKIQIINPEKGDVYRVKNESGYTTLKVKNVSKANTDVYLNDMETSNYSGIDAINVDKNYNTTQSFTKAKLKEMYDENIIYQIDREK